MRVLLVGADRLGNIPKKLEQEGFEEIIHWTGRNKSFRNKNVPKNIKRVIVFYNYINHGTMNSVKRQAKASGIPIIYGKLSQNSL
ncbi:MAG TPA: DUF2325 domain-containing protein [Desulfitobacteriaceae bacterium]|jgi:hypothetical protein|nr:DUF2325 domain-containing protein [Desulfitobacteriaceae bacterium]